MADDHLTKTPATFDEVRAKLRSLQSKISLLNATLDALEPEVEARIGKVKEIEWYSMPQLIKADKALSGFASRINLSIERTIEKKSSKGRSRSRK